MSEQDIRGSFLALRGALAADDEATPREAALLIAGAAVVSLWRIGEAAWHEAQARETARQAAEKHARDMRARGA